MKIKHVLIVGLGHISERYIKLLRLLDPQIQISGVSKRKNIPENIIEDIDSVYDELQRAPLDTVDLGIICSASSDHLREASLLIKNNIDVFIEKPLSDSMNGVSMFMHEHLQSAAKITVGYVLRYRPDLTYFFNLIKKIDPTSIRRVEVVASSYLPDWRPGRDYRTSVSVDPDRGGGVLLELSHELDYINWIFGPIVSVFCKLTNTGVLGIAVEEQAELTMRNQYGTEIQAHIDFISREQSRFCKVITDKEIYICNFIDKTVDIVSQNKPPIHKEFHFDFDRIYLQQLKEFISSMETENQPLVKLSEAVEVLRIIEKARESDRTNMVIAI